MTDPAALLEGTTPMLNCEELLRGTTEGPWAILADCEFSVDSHDGDEGQRAGGWQAIGNPDLTDDTVAIVIHDTRVYGWEPAMDANARLLAAAPDLAHLCLTQQQQLTENAERIRKLEEALREIERQLCRGTYCRECKAIRAILARTTLNGASINEQ
jgi:hypothetical protein